MKNTRLFLAIGVVGSLISVLVYMAATSTAQAVVTVEQLVREATSRQKVRLGARVTEDAINYQTEPEFKLTFSVQDIIPKEQAAEPLDLKKLNLKKLEVVYAGIRPDTFQPNRDVILEGYFDGKTFTATSLLTQCPSKYEVPLPQD